VLFMRVLNVAIVGAVALVAAPVLQSGAQSSRVSDSLDRPFVSGGRIQMDLAAGEYRIAGHPDNRIQVGWRVRNPNDLSRVRVRADIRGSDAALSTDGPGNGFSVEMLVPAHADLHVRLTAGELAIKGIVGNKDFRVHAGELDIDVGHAEDYKSVNASVWAGELHAEPYRMVKEGLFRSFSWQGPGSYRLRAHLKAGELRLRSSM
jgi:hypothetical protein